jgi:hypothetical protein
MGFRGSSAGEVRAEPEVRIKVKKLKIAYRKVPNCWKTVLAGLEKR